MAEDGDGVAAPPPAPTAADENADPNVAVATTAPEEEAVSTKPQLRGIHHPDLGPRYHIAGLPLSLGPLIGVDARGRRCALTRTERFINDHLDGRLDLPLELGVHLLQYKSFMVLFNEETPYVCLGEHPDLLAHVARSKFYAQPSSDAAGTRVTLPLMHPGTIPAPMGSDGKCAGRAMHARHADGSTCDVNKVIIVNWYIQSCHVTTYAPLAVTVGQKHVSSVSDPRDPRGGRGVSDHRGESGFFVLAAPPPPSKADAAAPPAAAAAAKRPHRTATTFLNPGENSTTLRAITRPNYDEIHMLMNTVSTAEIGNALAEEFGNDLQNKDFKVVGEFTATGSNITAAIARGDIPETEIGEEFDRNHNRSYVLHRKYVDQIKTNMRRDAEVIKNLGDLKKLGNAFVCAEPVKPQPNWNAAITFGLLFFYAGTVDDGLRADQHWISDVGE